VPRPPLSAESQAFWDASGAARDPRGGLLHAAGGAGAGFGFGGMPSGGGGGGDWMLFKHNSCEDVDMAVDEAMQVNSATHAIYISDASPKLVAAASAPRLLLAWLFYPQCQTCEQQSSVWLCCAALPAASSPSSG
jgi:hypothetical protein